MSKRFKNKPCVYCGEPGGTADHVFAREFFPETHRANLPQVSACSNCNGGKSSLEHYLLTVLPFGGSHPASQTILRDVVPRRLAKNQKLHLGLATGRQQIVVREQGSERRSIALPFDPSKLESYFEFVTRGLAAFHWGIMIPADYFVGAGLLNKGGELIFENLMKSRSNQEVRASLGDGLILYQGVQAVDDPCLTLWRYQLYGGIVLGGDPRAPSETSSNIWASTSRRPIRGLSAKD